MNWFKDTLVVNTHGKGLYDFTGIVQEHIRAWKVNDGMCFLYLQHTSASLVISENYDPTARQDMESFLERLVPENQPWMEHTLEGGDDFSSHLRTLITNTDLAFPIDGGKLSLGTWQGIYLFEHRQANHHRRVLIRVLSV